MPNSCVMMGVCIIILFCLTIQIINADQRIDPLVQTKVGLIQGIHASDGNYAMFMGIPYAQVDSKNQFGAHIAQPHFEGVFKATKEMNMCPQQEEFNNTITGTLDCLQLSVYVPDSASSNNLLPVMVWIHGGGFDYGYGGRISQGPAFIVKHDVILVTINYRLNIYGFMCLDIPEVPGNQGLRDQDAALNWVKNNINAFGGDDKSITLMGESAGAASVDLHLRYGKGDQFNKIILQSGSAGADWAIQEPDPKPAIKIAEYLGFEANDTKSAVNYMSTIQPKDIVAAYIKLGLNIRPCVEYEFDGQERFISDYAINIPITKAKNIPILLGCNNKELIVGYANKNSEYFDNLDIFRPSLIKNFNLTAPEIVKMVKLVKQFYMGDKEVSFDDINAIIDFDSDISYMYPKTRSIQEYLKNGATNIYSYLFSYNGERNFVKRRMNVLHVEGAAHADEIGYLFGISLFEEQPNDEDQEMIDRITTLWTNFAKFSDPTPEVTHLIPVKWPAVTPEKSYYLDIGSELVVGLSPMHDRMAFWDLFFLMMEQRRKGYKNTD